MFRRCQTHIQRTGLGFIFCQMIANGMAPFTVHITTNSGTVLKTISHSIQTVGTVILADHIFITLSNFTSILCML
jgi:hypothetical protein